LSWHVARFASGTEWAAARHLHLGPQLDGPRAFCPIEKRRWVDRGRWRERDVATLPGYVFVEFDEYPDYRWHEVAERPGFVAFVGSQQWPPVPVREHVVMALLRRADPETWLIDWGALSPAFEEFRRGDVVRLKLDIDINIQNGHDININIQNQVEKARILLPDGVHGQVEWVQAGGDVAWVSFKGLFDRETRMSISTSAIERVDIGGKLHKKRMLNFETLPERTLGSLNDGDMRQSVA